MTDSANFTRFGKMRLWLRKGSLLVEDRSGGQQVNYTIPLRRQLPVLSCYHYTANFWRFLRYGGTASMLQLLTAAGFASSGATAGILTGFAFAALVLMLLTYTSSSETGASRGKRMGVWYLIEYENGNRFGIPVPRRKTAEQTAFLAELETALKRYSSFEMQMHCITCGWDPQAFEILEQLRIENILSPEEFAELKQKRIRNIFRDPPPAQENTAGRM